MPVVTGIWGIAGGSSHARQAESSHKGITIDLAVPFFGHDFSSSFSFGRWVAAAHWENDVWQARTQGCRREGATGSKSTTELNFQAGDRKTIVKQSRQPRKSQSLSSQVTISFTIAKTIARIGKLKKTPQNVQRQMSTRQACSEKERKQKKKNCTEASRTHLLRL